MKTHVHALTRTYMHACAMTLLEMFISLLALGTCLWISHFHTNWVAGDCRKLQAKNAS
jgi:hypothetical protein